MPETQELTLEELRTLVGSLGETVVTLRRELAATKGRLTRLEKLVAIHGGETTITAAYARHNLAGPAGTSEE